MHKVYIPFAYTTRQGVYDILGVYNTLEAAKIAAHVERYSYAWIDIEETPINSEFQQSSQAVYRFEDDEEFAL
jgi:hypothetical protein